MLAKALLGTRNQSLSMSLALEIQIRGILKTFGRAVPKGAGGLFEKNVRALISGDGEIAAVIMPLLQTRQLARGKFAALDRRLIRSVQGDAVPAGTWARPFSWVRCGRSGPRAKPWEAGPSNAHHAAASCRLRRQLRSRHTALDREDC
jgi:hypothetical protein